MPDREQVIAQREAGEAAARGETPAADGEATVAAATEEKKESVRSTKRSSKRSAKVKKPKEHKPQNNSSNAARSVRRRK